YGRADRTGPLALDTQLRQPLARQHRPTAVARQARRRRIRPVCRRHHYPARRGQRRAARAAILCAQPRCTARPARSRGFAMNDTIDYADSAGLWRNNPALVQLLGLCPLLAVSTSTVTALGLGLATLFVLLGSNLAISLLRHQITPAIRLPAFVLIIGVFTTCVELVMQAQAYPLYQKLGIFVPLIVSNCIIVGRAHTFASRHGPLAALRDGLNMGLGFAAVLLTL